MSLRAELWMWRWKPERTEFPWTQSVELQATDNYFQVLKHNEIFPAGFLICLKPVIPFLSPISLYGNGNV